MARNRKFGRIVGGSVAGVVLLAGAFLFLTEPGRAFRDIWKTGALQEVIAGPEKREYNATTEANLKAIHTALMMYHDSEGAFPEASGWMDAIENRIGTADMEGSESKKKLISPSLAGQADQYGYAFNEKASGKYKDDLDAKMPLVFDSSDTKKNAHGEPGALAPKPPRNGANMFIAVDGTIGKL